MSAGCPIFPIGCMEMDVFNAFSFFVIFAVSGVLTKPGAMQFTLIFLDA
jgi:hypothetical protein